MADIEPNNEGQIVKSRKRIKRRKRDLLPANFSALSTDADRIEALRSLVIEQNRIILALIGEE